MTTSVIIHESKLQISHAHKCIGNIKKQKKSSPWREFSFSTDNRMHVLGECLSETTFCRTWLPQWYQDLPSYSFQFLLLCAVKHFPQWNVFLPHVRSKKNGSLPLGSKSNCKKHEYYISENENNRKSWQKGKSISHIEQPMHWKGNISWHTCKEGHQSSNHQKDRDHWYVCNSEIFCWVIKTVELVTCNVPHVLLEVLQQETTCLMNKVLKLPWIQWKIFLCIFCKFSPLNVPAYGCMQSAWLTLCLHEGPWAHFFEGENFANKMTTIRHSWPSSG